MENSTAAARTVGAILWIERITKEVVSSVATIAARDVYNSRNVHRALNCRKYKATSAATGSASDAWIIKCVRRATRAIRPLGSYRSVKFATRFPAYWLRRSNSGCSAPTRWRTSVSRLRSWQEKEQTLHYTTTVRRTRVADCRTL